MKTEKLELKHIVPYLPYGLKFMHDIDIWNLTGCSINSEGKYFVHGQYDLNDFTSERGFDITKCKPILRPLSDLTKEIEHNGEKFVPSEKINLLNGDYQLTDFIIDMNDYCVEYRDLIKLFEWHFDCFGLLYKGLAVDINTLNGTK